MKRLVYSATLNREILTWQAVSERELIRVCRYIILITFIFAYIYIYWDFLVFAMGIMGS